MGLSKKDTVDVLVGAFEGGSNYWIGNVKKTYPEKASIFSMPTEETKKMKGKKIGFEEIELDEPLEVPKDPDQLREFKKKTGFHGIYDTLLNGGELDICDDQKAYCGKVSMKTIREKIPQFIKKYPKKWKDIKEQNGDASTSDAFLQFMLFDEVIFG